MAEPGQPMDFPSESPWCGPDTPQAQPSAELVGPPRTASAPITVQWLDRIVVQARDRVRPHRHDYHELIWVREGSGRHLLDGRPAASAAGTITVIGRGQVHRFDEARGVSGAALDFSDEVLFAEPHPGGSATQAAPAWLVHTAAVPTVTVPPESAAGLEALLRALDDEARRPPDRRTADLQRHLLYALLLWIDRWYEDAAPRQTETGDARLHIRFARRLEGDFVRHHDAAHYAETLGVPAATLAHALRATTGRTTKELVLDRVMLEATRLLRFTDLAIGPIAYRCGYADPLYFSRAFKRHQGQSPANYRASVRGRAVAVADRTPASLAGAP